MAARVFERISAGTGRSRLYPHLGVPPQQQCKTGEGQCYMRPSMRSTSQWQETVWHAWPAVILAQCVACGSQHVILLGGQSMISQGTHNLAQLWSCWNLMLPYASWMADVTYQVQSISALTACGMLRPLTAMTGRPQHPRSAVRQPGQLYNMIGLLAACSFGLSSHLPRPNGHHGMLLMVFKAVFLYAAGSAASPSKA